jgi:hypothetical protein
MMAFFVVDGYRWISGFVLTTAFHFLPDGCLERAYESSLVSKPALALALTPSGYNALHHNPAPRRKQGHVQSWTNAEKCDVEGHGDSIMNWDEALVFDNQTI